MTKEIHLLTTDIPSEVLTLLNENRIILGAVASTVNERYKRLINFSVPISIQVDERWKFDQATKPNRINFSALQLFGSQTQGNQPDLFVHSSFHSWREFIKNLISTKHLNVKFVFRPGFAWLLWSWSCHRYCAWSIARHRFMISTESLAKLACSKSTTASGKRSLRLPNPRRSLPKLSEFSLLISTRPLIKLF